MAVYKIGNVVANKIVYTSNTEATCYLCYSPFPKYSYILDS